MDKKFIPKDIIQAYKTWVCNNPNVATDLETLLSWSSYFVAGKVNKSPVVSELVYCLSKFLSLYNDKLIREAYSTEDQFRGTRDRIKMWLTVIHYSEVLVELVVRQKWGNKGKWTAATLIQIVKCSSSLVLLYKYREVLISHPPVAMLQRRKFTAADNIDENCNSSFMLKRSGRVIRRVDGAPPVAFRDWQPMKNKDETPNPNLNLKKMTYAEIIHIVKPLMHLIAMSACGTDSLPQWLVSLSMDIASLKLYNDCIKDMTHEQKLEISRRKLGLLLYLLRSPIYEKYSKNVVQGTLKSVSRNIPFMSVITNPVSQYLNYWQNIYFYMWS